jgi:hypothetical protein
MDDTQWWLLLPEPDLLLWARLRLREDGGTELLEATGEVLRFDDTDAARHYLLSAGYRAWDGLDADDAVELGFVLDAVGPPTIADERLLAGAMAVRLR